MSLIKKYYSTSSPSSTKGKYKPIVVTLPVFRACDLLCELLDNMHCTGMIKNEKFYDVFCYRDVFEYSFSLTFSNGSTIIEISVYNEEFLKSSKKEFVKLYNKLNTEFISYLKTN